MSDIQQYLDATVADLAAADNLRSGQDESLAQIARITHLRDAVQSMDKAGHLIDTFGSTHDELAQFAALMDELDKINLAAE